MMPYFTTTFFSAKLQATNSFLTLWTVLIPLPVSLATSRMAYPLFRRLMTSLYSSLFLSWDLVEPVGLPSFPPFSTYCFLPEFSRNEILSRSNWAQVERVAIMTGANKDGLPSLSRSVKRDYILIHFACYLIDLWMVCEVWLHHLQVASCKLAVFTKLYLAGSRIFAIFAPKDKRYEEK